MLKPNERKDMIAKIRELPTKMEAAVSGLNDQQLDTPYGEGKWTPRQVVHHVADSHMQAFGRVKLILTEDRPLIKAYQQEEWAKLVDSNKLPVASSLQILTGLHHRWSTLLESVSEDSWQRTAIHPEHGEMKLEDFLIMYSRHGEKHVGHIMGLRGAKGW